MNFPKLLIIPLYLVAVVAAVIVIGYLGILLLSFGFDQRSAARLQSSGYIDKSGRFICHKIHETIYRYHYSNGLRKEQFYEKGEKPRRRKAFAFFDKNGKRAFPQVFYACEDFSEGLAAVETNEGKWGFIDTSGKFTIQPKFENAHSFKEGFAPVQSSGKWGFIDKNGEWLVKPIFDRGRPFREGLALIMMNGKVGYINESGEIQIPPEFDVGESFSDGVADVRKNPTQTEPGFFRCIDKKGKDKTAGVSIPPNNSGRDYIGKDFSYDSRRLATGQKHDERRYDTSEYHDQSNQSNRVLRVRENALENNAYGYFDREGHIAIPYKFDYAETFSEGVACVRLSNDYGFIDPNGKYVIKPRFKQARSFHEGLAFVQEKNGKCGFIDKAGRLVITIEGTTADDFYDGAAAVGDLAPMCM